MLQNLKCRTADHSKRRGEFVDIAEQCNNMTGPQGSQGSADGDYTSDLHYNGKRDRDNGEYSDGRDGGNRKNNDRRNNNREFSVRRQEFGNNNNNNGYNNDRGSGYGDRDTAPLSCADVRPQQQYSVSVLYGFIFLSRARCMWGGDSEMSENVGASMF